MDLLDRVGQKGKNKNSPDRMGLFQPQRRKAKTLLLAWLSASLRSTTSHTWLNLPMSALGQKSDIAKSDRNVGFVP
jgi:hypothetical protein